MAAALPALLTAATSAASTAIQYKQAKDQTDAAKEQIALQRQALDRQEERVKASASADARDREDLLKSLIARQKAAMGASGITFGSSSHEAVLDGLRKKAEQDAERDSLAAAWKIEDIDAGRQKLDLSSMSLGGANLQLAGDLLKLGTSAAKSIYSAYAK